MANTNDKEELRNKKEFHEWIKNKLIVLESKPIARFYYGLSMKYINPTQYKNFTTFFINQDFCQPNVIRTIRYTTEMLMALEEKDELEMYTKISNIMSEISSLRLERGETDIIIENIIRTLEQFSKNGKEIRSMLFEGITQKYQDELTAIISETDELLAKPTTPIKL